MWQQVYDPLGSPVLSTLAAALPVAVLLISLAAFHVRAHVAALAAVGVALLVAVFAFGMPAEMAGKAAVLGAASGLLPIGWIVLNVIFLYQLTDENGSFKVLQRASIAGITAGPAAAAAADRVLLRRVLRRRGRLRHAGRGDRARS